MVSTEIGRCLKWILSPVGFFIDSLSVCSMPGLVSVCSQIPPFHSSCCVFQQHWFLSVWPVADTERKMQGKGEARVLLVSLRTRRPLQQWLGFLSSSAPTEESHCDPSFFPGVPDHEFQEPHLSLYPLTSGCSDFLSHPSLDSLSIPYLVLSSSVISITNSLQ